MFWRIAGVAIAGIGVTSLAVNGLPDGISGLGIMAALGGLVIVLCTWSGPATFVFIMASVVFVTAIVRAFLGTGDWWQWLLLWLLMVVAGIAGTDTTTTSTATEEQGADSPSAASRTIAQLNPRRVIAGMAPTSARPTATDGITCSSCGASVPVGKKFCGACGQPVASTVTN